MTRPLTPRERRRRLAVALPITFVIVTGSWILLDYLMPVPCSVVGVIAGQPCYGTENLIASTLHGVAAAFISFLALPPMRGILRRIEDREYRAEQDAER